jgi:hypothetical protein
MADDPRDERLGAWLEVPPLDDVTRRRLVSTAADASDPGERTPSRAARWIAAAAAIVVVLVLGLALLTAPGGHDEQRASTPAGTPESEARSGVAVAPGAGAADSAPAGTPAAAPVEVGDFGDLSVADNLARLRIALQSGSAPLSSASGTARATSELDASPCRGQLPNGTVTALATGTLDGRRALVVLTVRADGSSSIDALLGAPCEVRPLS